MTARPGLRSKRGNPEGSDRYRQRLITGLASALAEKELGATTVADIVRHAHVSKRTFYEHFADKRECFAALAMSITDQMVEVIDQADRARGHLGGQGPGRVPDLHAGGRLQPAADADAGAGGAGRRPRGAAGAPAGLQGRTPRRSCACPSRRRSERADVRPISPAVATAIVAGINELMLEVVEEGRAERLTEVVDAAFELIYAVAVTAAAEPGLTVYAAVCRAQSSYSAA